MAKIFWTGKIMKVTLLTPRMKGNESSKTQINFLQLYCSFKTKTCAYLTLLGFLFTGVMKASAQTGRARGV